jgi:exopolyphosphatase/guanosine-5'-triphosphate,3'-diphosphate pyrophosphatase
VARLALEFFDGLVELHKLGSLERCWLECASTLHDIGLSKAGGGHNKKSAQIIVNDTTLPFASKSRRIIANIARYHRKALPKKKHYNLTTLDRETIQNVKTLSSFLRVADALDYTHESNVKSLHLRVGAKKITVECFAKKKSLLEEQAFNKKKDLFEKMFSKQLVLEWKQP